MPGKKKKATRQVVKKAASAKKTVTRVVAKKPIAKMSVAKKSVATKPVAMNVSKSPAIVKMTTVKPQAKTVTKRVKSAPKSLALKGDKRILTHAAWKREMMKKRLKKS